jgi:hypothetical protein
VYGVRQPIADSWLRSLDASAAKEDGDFAPRFDLAAVTTDSLAYSASSHCR